MNYLSEYLSPVGKLILASDGENLIGAWFEGQKNFGSSLQGESADGAQNEVIKRAKAWLESYFSGKEPTEAPPVKLVGTPFELKVWGALRLIPYGQTATYGEVAAAAGYAGAARAAGGAVGRNPISLIVPCHRVVGAGGRLGGYAGGADKKRFLLGMEGVKFEIGGHICRN